MSNLEGAMLSDYLLLQCISRGGVADVYRARQTGEGSYEVAVKVFRPGYAQRESFRDYFMAEAEKVGQFDHPNILPFLEFGEGEGLLYAVTPFVSTGTLDDLLRRVGGKFSAIQSLPIMQQLCSSVQYAHDRNVLHGNIKPTNIFVAADGRMLLSDFGITRGYDDNQQSLTRIGWGSAEYAAPEQSLGILRGSSDIYSLGVVLFRILTGRTPFTGQTPVEVLLKHVRQQPPSVRSIEPSISDAVDGVVQIAMQKRSDDRFTSTEEFSNALLAAVTVAPIASPVARPVSLVTRQLTLDSPPPQKDPHTPVPATIAYTLPPERPPAPSERFDVEQPVAERPDQHAEEEEIGEDVTEIRGRGFLARDDDAGPHMFWTEDPLEWSPVGDAAGNAMSLTAGEYLRSKPMVPDAGPQGTVSQKEPAQEAKEAKSSPEGLKKDAESLREPESVPVEKKPDGEGIFSKKLLPILVVILLLIGLLAALLSSFLFPAPSGGHSNVTAPSTISNISFLSTGSGVDDLVSGWVVPFKDMSGVTLQSHLPGPMV